MITLAATNSLLITVALILVIIAAIVFIARR